MKEWVEKGTVLSFGVKVMSWASAEVASKAKLAKIGSILFMGT
jgi:hypothetical protein